MSLMLQQSTSAQNRQISISILGTFIFPQLFCYDVSYVAVNGDENIFKMTRKRIEIMFIMMIKEDEGSGHIGDDDDDDGDHAGNGEDHDGDDDDGDHECR